VRVSPEIEDVVRIRGIETMLGIDFVDIGILPAVYANSKGQLVTKP
jgi:hypothetical protein